MPTEFEQSAFGEAMERKHKIASEIEIKKDVLGSLKRREHQMTDEEREEMRKIEAELKKLDAELKEAQKDAERFTPTR